MKEENQKRTGKRIVFDIIIICMALLFVQTTTASSQQLSIPLIDTASGAVIGEARATLTFTAADATHNTLTATNQVYTLNTLANFVGYVSAATKLSPISSLPERASSATNKNQDSSGQFEDMTIAFETEQSTTQIIVTYEVGGSGNPSATDDSQGPITVTITGKKETIFARETTTPPPPPPNDGGDQTKTEVLCSCSPCGQNVCSTKDVRECPAAVKAEQSGGTVSIFANKQKTGYGNWDGGVARSDAGKFAGTCTGCSNLFPIILADVKARDRAACVEACNAACTSYKTKYQDQARVDADRAAQDCFNWISDACATVQLTPAKEDQKKENEPKEEQKPKGEDGTNTPKEPPQEQQGEQPEDGTGVITKAIDWVKSIWEWLFGKVEPPQQPEPPKQKLCTCLCQKECTTTKADGCATAEQTEKTGGGKIFEWGVVTGKVPNGGWSGLVKKQPDDTFKRECTLCRDAINIADVLSDADGNCDNPCKTVCKNNADAINNRAGNECQARLREACA